MHILQNRAALAGAPVGDPYSGDRRHPSSDGLDLHARKLVGDLHTPSPVIYWADLVGSAVCGWLAFAAAIHIGSFSVTVILLFVIAVLALYRGLAFTHELSHLRTRALPGFETVWNVLFGVPLLLPSFTYIGVHSSHHNLATYGTKDDPEYLPFARSRRLIIGFGIQSALLLPALLVCRFLLLAPIGLASRRFHRWLETHASSFAMNPEFRRQVPPDVAHKMRRWEIVIIGAWGAALVASVYTGTLPQIALVWMSVLMSVSILNTFRVLGAHEYESDGHPRSRLEQLKDSIDTPGGPWTELWAPVGLRYHALHHYFPGIPYHNLGAAYRRLIDELPIASQYRQFTSPGLRASLWKLYASAKRGRSA